MFANDLTIGILGLGQIGGSIACALKKGYRVSRLLGYDTNRTLCKNAISKGIVDRAPDSAEELMKSCDVIILALPVFSIAETLRNETNLLRSKKLVTDTGSLKSEIMASAESLDNFIGGHPLAGTELSGEESWNANLFVGANYFVTENKAATSVARQLIDGLISGLGATKIVVEPEAHDQLFATSSNLPHLFAYLLKSQFSSLENNGTGQRHFECPSYYGATRVAASDPEMVFQMLWGNRKHLSSSLSDLRRALDEAQKALDSGDQRRFRQIFGSK